MGHTCGEPHELELTMHVLTDSLPLLFIMQAKFGAEHVAMLRTKHVDGELLLQLESEELKDDLGMTSSLDRKRFMMEINRLRKSADR